MDNWLPSIELWPVVKEQKAIGQVSADLIYLRRSGFVGQVRGAGSWGGSAEARVPNRDSH